MLSKELTKRQIRRIGESIKNCSDCYPDEQALAKIGLWREAHIEVIQKTTDAINLLGSDFDNSIYVSRLKRIDTIIDKLRRPGNTHKLDTMCDIAGCRLIVDSEKEVRNAVNALKNRLVIKKELDYITDPRNSGYRGYHLIVGYDTNSYTNLQSELQIRTKTQHAWATAVEMYDLIARTRLKFDSGSDDEKRFFQLAAHLMQDESMHTKENIDEISELDNRLRIRERLNQATSSMYFVPQDKPIDLKKSDSCIVEINIDMQQITVSIYPENERSLAAEEYTRLESTGQDNTIYLLASASSLEDLSKAYPNYFSDISGFCNWLNSILSDRRL